MLPHPLARRHWLQMIAGAGFAACCLGSSNGSVTAAEDDEEEELKISEVPEAIRAAANKAVAGAKWTTAYRYKEDDEVIYDLEGKDSKRRPVTVVVTAAGKVEETETEIRMEDVPEVVKDALKAKFPRFKAKFVFEINEDGEVTAYDFEGRRPIDKESITISVSADGKTVEIDDE